MSLDPRPYKLVIGLYGRDFFYGGGCVWWGSFIRAGLMSFKGLFADGLEAFCDVFLVWWLYSFGVLF